MDVACIDAEGRLSPAFASDLRLVENGVERSILDVTCRDTAPRSISAVLAIDISASMAEHGRIQAARAAARAFIGAIDLRSSQCAITTFNGRSYFDQDFTLDRERLLAALDSLAPRGGTSYDAALIEAPGGAIPAVATGRGRRIVILLTDGDVGGDQSAIVQMARQKGVVIYPVVLDMSAPPLLLEVARRTGGFCFDHISSADGVRRAFLSILELARRAGTCRVEWQSGAGCEIRREVIVNNVATGLSDTSAYLAPLSGLATLEVTPTTLRFGAVSIGSSQRMGVTVIARGQAVTLSPVISSDSCFRIVSGGGPDPVILQPDVPRLVTVEYVPVDSGGAFAELTIASSACASTKVYATGGFPGQRPSKPTLRVVSPNGGEFVAAGGDTTIEWAGVAPEDTVLLECSTDGGTTWNPIERKAHGLRWRWSVPVTPSSRCLIRAAQIAEIQPDTVMIGVNAAWGAFHPNGQMVGTCSNVFHLFDVKTGLPATGDPASFVRSTLSIEFSPDGTKFLTVGNGDQNATLWNSLDGGAIRTFGPHTGTSVNDKRRPGGILSARFGMSGAYVVTDRTALISLVDGTELGRLVGHTGPLTGADIAPNGLLAATSSTDTTACIWTVATRTVVRTLKGHSNELNSVRFSSDGSRVVTASDDGTACIWDVAGGAIIARLTGHTGWVRYAEFSPDGRDVLTASEDGTAVIWDATTGSRRQTFVGHAGAVRTARFSPDGLKVLTIGSDGTARIWDVAERRLQEDVSDDLWTITSSSPEVRAVDLGIAPVGGYKDSVIGSVICNPGTVPVVVRSISFSGGSAASLSLIAGKAPYVLSPGECRDVEIRFAPGVGGASSASIVVETSLRTLSAPVTGRGAPPALRARELVDVGTWPIGETHDTTVTLLLENVSPLPVSVVSTSLLGPDSRQFSIRQGGGAFTLGVGESRTLELRFAAGRVGRTSGRIVFDVPDEPAPVEVGLFAEGTCANISAENALALSIIDTISADPGDTITVPVRIGSPAILSTIESTEITITVEVDGTVLFPINGTRTLSRNDTSHVFSKTIPVLPGRPAPSEIPLSFVVGLGDAEISHIDLRGFEAEAICQPPYVVTSGVFHLVGICREGGPRLFQSGPMLQLKPVRPDPVSTTAEVELELMERGRTRLVLRDQLGRTMQTLFDEDVDAGPRLVALDAGELPTGAYVLVLETPTRMLHRPLKVLH